MAGFRIEAERHFLGQLFTFLGRDDDLLDDAVLPPGSRVCAHGIGGHRRDEKSAGRQEHRLCHESSPDGDGWVAVFGHSAVANSDSAAPIAAPGAPFIPCRFLKIRISERDGGAGTSSTAGTRKPAETVPPGSLHRM